MDWRLKILSKLEKLVEESVKIGVLDYLNLMDEVNSRLKEERKTGINGSHKVEDGLIYLRNVGWISVVGDIHGDLESLVYILKDFNFLEDVKEKGLTMLFLGDYGDRGIHSPEVYYVIFQLKRNYPENVILLRGNHEGPSDLLAIPHDLPHQLKWKFKEEWEEIYRKFLEFFDNLPHSAILESKYLFLHGGIPSQAENLKDLADAAKKHPEKSFLEEILWSDPEEGLKGVFPSPRGAGKLFGEDVTKNFLEKIGVKTLIRGHEPCMEGVKVNHHGKILTIFSRKGEPYFNAYAAYLKIDGKMEALNAYQLKTKATIF